MKSAIAVSGKPSMVVAILYSSSGRRPSVASANAGFISITCKRFEHVKREVAFERRGCVPLRHACRGLLTHRRQLRPWPAPPGRPARSPGRSSNPRAAGAPPSRTRPALNSAVLDAYASCPSGPASCESASAKSRMLRAIGPTCQKRRGARGQIPVIGTRPCVALSETMPV